MIFLTLALIKSGRFRSVLFVLILIVSGGKPVFNFSASGRVSRQAGLSVSPESIFRI